MRNRTLVMIAVVALGAYLLLRGRVSTADVYGQGQAGSIFGPGLRGGGQ